jgi:hypothetical protein
MFITLNNAHPEHKNQKVTVNADNIVTMTQRNRWMFDGENDHEGHSETVTFLFMPPHGSWEVCETIPEINRMINIPFYAKIKNVVTTLFYTPEAASPPPPPVVTITPVVTEPEPNNESVTIVEEPTAKKK